MTNLFKISTLLLVCFRQFGCSKDDPKLIPELNITEATLKYDQDVHFRVPNFSNVTWSSSNEFVGTVDKSGKFTAHHIGETTVTATVDGHALTASVVVEPYIANIVEPLINFGGSVQSVKDYEKRELYIDYDYNLVYFGQGDLESTVDYYFSNGSVTSASIHFKRGENIMQNAIKFYEERYFYIRTIDYGVTFFESADRSYSVIFTRENAIYTNGPIPGSTVIK